MNVIAKSRLGRSIAVAAAVAGASAGIALYATQASAQTTTHTMQLTTKQVQDKIVDGIDVATDKDMQNGAVTGYDVTSCRINFDTHVATCDIALARAHGMLYAHGRVNVTTGKGHGTVTGGTRYFAGATGTFAVDGAKVTITYTV